MQRAIEGFVWSLIIMHSSAYSTALRGPNIHFDTDKAEVINQNTVREFAGRVAGRAKNIRLYCYTDGRASFEYNVELANKRCKSVAALLNEAGLDPQQLIIIGERHPEVEETGKDIAGRRGVNRRVEIYYDTEPKKVYIEKLNRHRVTLAAGYAPSGLKPTEQVGPNEFLVKEDWDVEFGASYSYRITPKWNIGVTGYTNKSGFLHLGLDF